MDLEERRTIVDLKLVCLLCWSIRFFGRLGESILSECLLQMGTGVTEYVGRNVGELYAELEMRKEGRGSSHQSSAAEVGIEQGQDGEER